MKNKIAAFIERGEIRDCFDIEFLLQKGVELSINPGKELDKFRKKLEHLSDLDFKVKLGSILDSDIREYYMNNRFGYLKEKMSSIL
jgi:hypothetical protein